MKCEFMRLNIKKQRAASYKNEYLGTVQVSEFRYEMNVALTV